MNMAGVWNEEKRGFPFWKSERVSSVKCAELVKYLGFAECDSGFMVNALFGLECPGGSTAKHPDY
jgi:hypothetical protein